MKPQWVDHIPRAVKGQVGKILRSKDKRGSIEKVLEYLDLKHLENRESKLLLYIYTHALETYIVL